MWEFVCRRKILARFLLRLFTYRLNLSSLGDVRSRFSGMERYLGYLTARPGLGIIHFNLEDFYADANIITQQEDHFDRQVRENFHKVNEKMGTGRVSAIFAYFRLFSLNFAYFRLFSFIFAYFRDMIFT